MGGERDYLNRVTYMTPDGTARHVTYDELIEQNKGAHCRQCGAPMNPAAAMLGPVCGNCRRANHRKAVGR